MVTSVIFGTCQVCSPVASRQAAISFRTAFLGAEGLYVALECSGGLDDEGCHSTSIAGDGNWPGTRSKRSATLR